MKQSIVHVALVVRDYDKAIRFYTQKLNFTVVEDTYQPEQDKRWVLIAPPGAESFRPDKREVRGSTPRWRIETKQSPATRITDCRAFVLSLWRECSANETVEG
jgi:catechol 2,3-dioxygenase-like lactoylglutathione lyase family enzyme